MTNLPRRKLGDTGLEVSALGLGCGQLGDDELDDAQVARLLDEALDLGINLFDTARSYGASEERLGRHLRGRRQRVVLSTKLGYGIAGIPDWTGRSVAAGVDEALSRLCTDYLDIVHLHSCPIETLIDGAVVEALEDAARAGKVRVIAYSGENEALRHAASCGRFGSLQTSVNVCDQWSLRHVLPHAPSLGIIAKRPLANAFWRFVERPTGAYAECYFERWQAMAAALDGIDPAAVALRFAAWAPGVSAAIAGTTSITHLRANVQEVAAGPLGDATVARLREAFERLGSDWPGDV